MIKISQSARENSLSYCKMYFRVSIFRISPVKKIEQMPPKKKFRSGRSKKRRFAGNRYTVKEKRTDNAASIGEESSEQTEASDTEENKRSLSINATKVKSLPASVRKLDEISCESDNNSSKEYPEGPEGFRLVDISVLSAVFHLLCCPVCKNGRVELQEDSGAKMGFASLFVLKCENQKCKFFKKFYGATTEYRATLAHLVYRCRRLL